MNSGKKLIQVIDNTVLDEGELAFWWLGQHSFIVKLLDRVLYLDPFLTEMPERQVPPLLSPNDITNASLFFGSHDHGDHIDRPVWPALANASPNAPFIVPDLLRKDLATDIGIDLERLIGLDDGKTVEFDGIRITGIAAAHEFLDQDPLSGRYPYLGFVVEGFGCCVYYAGDTCIYEGLLTKLKQWQFDVMFLPINGRDAERLAAGCVGNMTYQEAVDLAGTLNPRLAVPAHYDMFAMNPGDPNAFAQYMKVKYPAVPVCICEYATCNKLESVKRP